MINMLAQVLKEDWRVHSLYEEHCGQDQQLSPVNCSGSRKWFKDGSISDRKCVDELEEKLHDGLSLIDKSYFKDTQKLWIFIYRKFR